MQDFLSIKEKRAGLGIVFIKYLVKNEYCAPKAKTRPAGEEKKKSVILIRSICYGSGNEHLSIKTLLFSQEKISCKT